MLNVIICCICCIVALGNYKMNSTISNDLNREHLAFETAQCLKNIHANTKNISTLHKELLEINLSVTAYIEESKNRLRALRLELAHQASSSQKVVEVFSDKWSPKTPQKRKSHSRNVYLSITEANNNVKPQISKQQSAKNFIVWYKSKIDNDRQSLSSYLSDEITLEWFGRTIKTRKKVSSFVKNDIQCSRHDFTSVESIDKIQTRTKDTTLVSPLQSSELEISQRQKTSKRKLQSTCLSPQWAEGCGPDEESEPIEKKKKKKHNLNHNNSEFKDVSQNVIGNKGDGVTDKMKSKHSSITPPNIECGQGDCLPSTSGTNPESSGETMNIQLPKLAVECNGYIEFTRTRNNRSADSMKWDRRCKVQISYSEDPLNVGEYIIWALRYSDENKCRRNLLAAFEEVVSD